LTEADFELKQDGKEQKIATFEEVKAETAAAQAPPMSGNTFSNQVIAPRPKNLQIIAIDLVNTSFSNQKYARDGLIDFLTRSVNEDALLALVAFVPGGVRLIHNFTNDRSVLVSAIKRVKGATSAVDTSTLTVRGADEVEAAQLDAILSGGDIAASRQTGIASMAGAAAAAGAVAGRVDVSREAQAGLVTLECFQEVALYFASVPGRKSLMWASSAFQFGNGNFSGDLTRGITPEDWQRTVRTLQDANIAVYPVDVSGLTGSIFRGPINNLPSTMGGTSERSAALQAVEAGRGFDPTQAKHETMQEVADRTGGVPYYNSNDLGKLFHQASQDSNQYYMLAFYTKDISKQGWHKIQLKCHHEGSQLRYRSGFIVTKEMTNPELARQQDEFHAISSYLNFTSLPINGMWQQIEPAGDKRKAHFLLNLPPGVTSIDTDHENHIDMDFLAVAMDANGKEAANINQRLNRKLPPPGVAQIQANGLTYVNTLTLSPGEYKVHIAVRDNLSGKVGSVVTPLRVE
jgi:VWFA-related protein